MKAEGHIILPNPIGSQPCEASVYRRGEFPQVSFIHFFQVCFGEQLAEEPQQGLRKEQIRAYFSLLKRVL